ncbi:MAG: hypothetical protein CMH58_07930, partial [Myxococcales bacterium]|nr:hypothetical protein [Myxococcales bacterium]
GEVQVWRLDETNAVGDARLPNGEACEDFSRCSSAQIVELGSANEAGVRPVVRVLSDEIPLRLFQDGEDHYFEVEVPHTSMGAGGWLGLRLVANRVEGEALRWSEPVPFFAQPPFDWVGPGPGGTGGQVQILGPVDGEANRTIAIRGGHRIQLDEDEALEMVVCGQDNRGKVFAVVHLDPDGSLPDEPVVAQRSHLFEGRNLGAGSNLRAEDACRLADLNGDGHLDLVMPGRTDSGIVSAGYPNVAIHHGLGGGEFTPAQRVVWVELRLRDRTLRAFEVSTEPLAIIACAASSLEVLDDRACSERYRLPLERDGLGWRIEVNSFDRLQADDEEPLLSSVIPAPDLAVAGHGFVHTEDGVLSTLSIREDRRLPGDDDVRSLAFEAGSQRLALSRSRPGMELWDLASDEPPLRWVIEGNDVVYDVAFQPGGNLVAANHGSSLFLWNLETGDQDMIGGLFPSSLVSLAFHPEGDRLVGAAGQGVRIIDVVGRESVRIIDHEEVRVRAVAFHPDGRQIASLDQNGVIRLWDPETGQILDRFEGTEAAGDLGYSPNGQFLAVVGENDVALWGVEAGRLVRRLVGHSHNTRTLSFHRDGTLLATGAQDARLRLWDVHTGEELWRVQAHRNTVSAVAFSPSNDLLAAGSQDDSVKLWNLKRRTDIPLGDLHDGIGVPLAHPERAEPWTWIASFEGDQLKLQRPVSWRSGCGNGVVQDGEMFDRGQEWFQDEYRTQCGATCGDGITQQGEACDDGNDNDADECPSTCQAHRCGDGLVRQDLEAGAEGYESCDDGNVDPWDGCGACNRCGDGLRGPFEGCDDGNDVGGDGCTDCVLDTCGNGIVDEDENCDLGNREGEGACAIACIAPACEFLGSAATGSHTIVTIEGQSEVLCEMDLWGGGWTRAVFFRRGDRTWDAWSHSVGLPHGDQTGLESFGIPLQLFSNTPTGDGEDLVYMFRVDGRQVGPVYRGIHRLAWHHLMGPEIFDNEFEYQLDEAAAWLTCRSPLNHHPDQTWNWTWSGTNFAECADHRAGTGFILEAPVGADDTEIGGRIWGLNNYSNLTNFQSFEIFVRRR